MLMFRLLLVAALLPGAGARADDALRLVTGGARAFELPENPSTGYTWRLDAGSSEGLDHVQITDRGHRRGANLPGAPGVRTWTIRALKRGAATIQFAYQRPWEPEPIETRRVLVEIAR